MTHRRKSVDSSSSSDSDSDYKEGHHGHKDKKDKKHKKDKASDKQHGEVHGGQVHSGYHHDGGSSSAHTSILGGGFPTPHSGHSPTPFPGSGSEKVSFPGATHFGEHGLGGNAAIHESSRDHIGGSTPLAPPPPYQPRAPPPSGYRIPLNYNSTFPSLKELGPPACYEPDGVTPLYLGSALMDRSVHPCKIGAHLNGAQVAYAGSETGHSGRYDLLPFVPEQMEWVRTSHGQIPQGRRPIEGGYEEGGQKLYHALVSVNGIRVPGKTGEHLKGANAGFGGNEYVVQENYDILCWRQ
ncbi:hypothetical protein BDN72DRAFT_266644 [Pluteus cervinus]|uniref:Uncharacterized protein n=1 Tax=Pluteus cervinus TaxID=181527 RepID=A0ACD3B5E7_9AGAR|nr:hypothetical protein BDN72DRAFT_266644 [Pluteus cervinus]